MMTLAMTVTTEAAALAVGFAAVCRLSQLHVRRYDGVAHRPGWVLTYLAMALGAVFVFFEAAQADLSAGVLILLVTCAMWLWLSRETWRGGPPKYLERPALWMPKGGEWAADPLRRLHRSASDAASTPTRKQEVPDGAPLSASAKAARHVPRGEHR
jgi:hypothetical protein